LEVDELDIFISGLIGACRSKGMVAGTEIIDGGLHLNGFLFSDFFWFFEFGRTFFFGIKENSDFG
jgi:hypothetical protein